jgi:hypothetical protein
MRMEFGQTLNVRLGISKTKIESRQVQCQGDDNDIANVEVKS